MIQSFMQKINVIKHSNEYSWGNYQTWIPNNLTEPGICIGNAFSAHLCNKISA